MTLEERTEEYRNNRKQIETALELLERDEDSYFKVAQLIWDALTSGQREQLNQLLHQGPVWDGNVISKSDRSDLIDFKLATRVCFRGEHGYTAATYLGGSVFRQGKATPFEKKSGSMG